jgi:hypothetical protein
MEAAHRICPAAIVSVIFPVGRRPHQAGRQSITPGGRTRLAFIEYLSRLVTKTSKHSRK